MTRLMSFVPSCLLSLVLQYGILAHAQTFEQNAVTLSLPTTNGATETLEDYNAPVLLPLSPPGHLITLTRLIDGGSTYVPVGRSYAGHDWENVPGPEEKLQYLCDGEGSERKCQVFLRSDEEFTYQLTTYNHSLSPRNEIARFLERVSFGPTTATPSSSPTTAIPTPLQSSSLPSTATPSGSPPSTATPSGSPPSTATPSGSPPSTATPSRSPPSTATPSGSPPSTATPSGAPSTATLTQQDTAAPSAGPTETIDHQWGLEQPTYSTFDVVLPDSSDTWPAGYPSDKARLIEYDTEYYIPNTLVDVDIEFDLGAQRLLTGVYLQSWYVTTISGSIEIGVAPDDGRDQNDPPTLPETDWTWFQADTITGSLNVERTQIIPRVPSRYVKIRLRGGSSTWGDKWGLRNIQISGELDGVVDEGPENNVESPESTTATKVLASFKISGASNETEACSISNEIGQSSRPNNSIIVQETCTVESLASRRRRLENTILVLSTFSITSDSTTDQSTITNVFAQNINNINTNTVYDGISLQVLTVKQVIDFDFTIDFDSNCTDIQFNDARSAEELHFCFIIADKPADLKLYTKDCQTNISSESIIFNDITRKDSILVATRDVYEVNLDVIQGLIQSDDAVWTYDAAAMKGMIEFCMRMDLYADAARTQSVNFLEVLASIEVDMTTGFDVVSISTDRDAATNETATAKVNYTLNSYQCESADGGSSSLAMSQGSVLGLCIDLADDTEGVELDKVWGLSLNQTNGGSSSPIESGEVNGLTTSACTYNGGKRCFIETMLISAFFEKDAENADIVAQGTVLLKFGRRRLEARLQFDEEHIEKEIDERELAVQSKQEDPSPENFLVIISTQGAVREDIKGPSSPEVELNNGSIAIGGVSVGLLVLFVGCFGLVAYLRHKKKKTDQQGKIGVPVDDSAELMPFT